NTNHARSLNTIVADLVFAIFCRIRTLPIPKELALTVAIAWYDTERLDWLLGLRVGHISADHERLEGMEHIFLLAGRDILPRELHSVRRADVGLQRFERGAVPFPHSVFIGVLGNLVEFEVFNLLATPSLEKYARLRNGLLIFVQHPDPNFSAGFHCEV